MANAVHRFEQLAKKTIAGKVKAEIESKLADFESGRISLAEFQTLLDETNAALSKTDKAATRSVPEAKAATPSAPPAKTETSLLKNRRGTARQSTPPSSPSFATWPPNAATSYHPSLIAAIAGSVGVMVGTIGPWVTALIMTVTGLDAGNWGIAALTLGRFPASLC